MREEWEEVWDAVVFGVARMVFGDEAAMQTVYQNIIRHALVNVEVFNVIQTVLLRKERPE